MTGREGDRAVFGPIDASALRVIRETFTSLEPLVATAELDDPMNPQTLQVAIEDGIGEAAACRFDVRWSTSGCYSLHYTDDCGRDFRFDRHPKPDASTAHFHPPPDAPSRPVEPSCIGVREAPLVARAVHQRWRDAYERDTLDRLNDASDPP